MARVPALDPACMTDEERTVFTDIAGPRGGVVGGPFAIWMRNTALASAANRLGNQLRVSGTLDKRLFELMVLITARRWSAQYEWFAHEQAALDNGLAPDIVEAVRNGTDPAFARDDERLVHDLTTELLERRALSDDTYRRALDMFGLDLMIEIVADLGFYTMVAITLVAFDAPVPGGARPLPALDMADAT